MKKEKIFTKDLTKEVYWWQQGYDACKEEVLKILQQDLQNCDLSTDSCDSRYIEKIKDL